MEVKMSVWVLKDGNRFQVYEDKERALEDMEDKPGSELIECGYERRESRRHYKLLADKEAKERKRKQSSNCRWATVIIEHAMYAGAKCNHIELGGSCRLDFRSDCKYYENKWG